MTADLSLRVFTGAGGATMSSAQTAIALCDADALSGGDIVPGTVSYERWIALRIDTAPVRGVANFWMTNTGDLPTGVSLKFGITDTPRTPVNTVSPIATMDLTSGRRFLFDTDTHDEVGDLTRYVVIQAVAASDAPSGPIDLQDLQFGWQEA